MRAQIAPWRLFVGFVGVGMFLTGAALSAAKSEKPVKKPAVAESAAAKIAAAKVKTGNTKKPALAGNIQTPGPVERTRVVPLADDGKGPDVSALRYYVSQGQKDRVEIEIKRLQTLYPNWQVPSSIYDTRAAGAVDEQPLWDLYAAGEMDVLQAEITKRMSEEPGWRPSADLADKIKRKNQRIEITKLWKSGEWKKLLAFVKAEGFDGADADVDILWTVAEAYSKTKQLDKALATYKSIMKHNQNPEQRLATVQKAMATLPMSLVEDLIKLSKTNASGENELAPIATDITRARISAFLHDERLEEVDKKEVEAFEKYARKASDANQPGLVAWYNYKRKKLPEALDWFKFAISRGGDTMIAHGLAHTLRELKLKRDTEEVSYAWRQPLVNNAILFIDILERDLTRKIPPYIEPARLRRYAQVSMDSASGEGAQGLAWYAYNTCQFKTALKWFRHANAWHPKEATAYGLAITLRRLKIRGEFWDLINRYDGLFPKVIEIIYPDDYVHPRTPCDITRRYLARMRAKLLRNHGAGAAPSGAYPQAGYLTPRQTLTPSHLVSGARSGRLGNRLQSTTTQNGLLAPWQQQQGFRPKRLPLRKNIREPRISKSLFPVSVDSQNPLRRWPTGRLMGPPATANRIQFRGLKPEPPLKMDNLVARRVPGVGPMPYERWGYALLPSYKGDLKASAPHEAVTAPKGTLWTTLHAKDAQSTRQDDGSFFDMTTAAGLQNAELALEAIKRAPRVPAPEESKTGPWSSPKPYKSEKQLAAEQAPVTGATDVAASTPGQTTVIRASVTPAAEEISRRGFKPVPSPASPVAPQPEASATKRKSGATALPEKKSSAGSARSKNSSTDASALFAAQRSLKQSKASPAPIKIVPVKQMETTSGLRIETGARDELGRLATNLYNNKQYAKSLVALNRRAARLPETTRLRMLRAWALLNLRRVDEARVIFATLGSRRRATDFPVGTRKN